MTSQIIHIGRRLPRQVWAVFHLPSQSEQPPSVLWYMPVPVNLDTPCVACHRVGIEGPCPGVRAHAYAQQVRLSVKIRLQPLEVALFTLPPGMAPEQCSGEIFAQIQNWRR